jgi:surface-anchored protein
MKPDKFRAGALWATLVLLLSAPARLPAVDLFTAGHADVSIVINGSAFDFEYELAANAVLNGTPIGSPAVKAPGDLITVVPDSSKAVGGVSGLPGAWANNTFWYLPQVSTTGVPFLGLGAEEIAAGQLVGEFLMFQSGLTAPTVFINTADGVSGSEFINLAALSHNHYNWSFSTPGTYQIRFKAEGTLATGNVPITGFGTYNFQIVPEPGTWALGAVSIFTTMLIGYRKRRQKA